MGLLESLGLRPLKKTGETATAPNTTRAAARSGPPAPATGAAPPVAPAAAPTPAPAPALQVAADEASSATAPAPAPAPTPAPHTQPAREAVRAGGGGVVDAVQQAAFATARVVAASLIDTLRKHSQAAAIQTLIAQAQNKLNAADTHAGKREWPQAMQALEDVKAIGATAKKAADDRQAFTVKLADVTMGRNAFERFDNGGFTLMQNAITNANAQAAANNYVAANATLDAAATTLRARVKNRVDGVNQQLTNSTANAAAAAFLKPELDKARGFVAAAGTALGARRWSEAVMAANSAMWVLSTTERLAPRRTAFDTARTATLAKIAAVKAVADLAERGPGLDALLADADKTASLAVAKFETGIAQLADIDKRCDAILAARADTEAYKRQRPPTEAELDALSKHAGAARVKVQIETARQQLEQAAKAAAGALTAVDPGPGWAAASNTVVRVRADIAAAKAIADGAGAAAGAEAAAANPGDVAAMKTALATLQADHQAAAGAAFAAEAAAPLKTCKEQIDKATQALGKNDGKAAAKPMAAAAQALMQAKAIQVAQKQFTDMLPSVETRLATLQGLPNAAQIKAAIDPAAKALADAKAKHKAKAGTEAMAALRSAVDLIAAATQANAERGKFNTAETATSTHLATVTDAKVKKPLEAQLAAARKLADGLKFGEALAALKKLEVAIDKAELLAKAKANPADPALTALAKRMADNGGAKEVDDLIQAPGTTDPRMIAALASGRFDVAITADTAASAATEAENMKALCKTFAKVPKEVKSFGSITSIAHTDSASSGGGWGPDGAVTLSGRPKKEKQAFGTGQTATDTTGKTVKQLPADVDKDCLPVAKETPSLGFVALHEVGHGVDDSKAYMSKNGSRADHGGWKNYGSNVQAIADAVGPHIRGKAGGSNTFYTKPEDKKYVVDKLLNQKPARPASVVAGSDDAKAYDAFDRWHRLATSNGIWDRQGDSEEIAINNTTVYHEAYPREWVSYDLAARKKGLTGYQFRAPAEWFAELYAGFKSDILGPKHPARAWLKDL